MRRRRAAAGALLGVILTGSALGCPCSDDAGAGAVLTGANQLYAFSLVATARSAHGHFDAFGDYQALGAGESETSEELLLRGALRLPVALEWQAELGYAAYRLRAPSIVQDQAGIGDLLARALLSVSQEGMPHSADWLPSLSLSSLVRAPLGSIASGRSSGFGSGGAQLGLGAWELGAGLDASRAVLPELRLSFGAEAAYRFPDHALGRARQLGPRLDMQLGASLEPVSWLSAVLALRARTSGDVELEQRTLDGTSERLISLVVGGNVYGTYAGSTSVRCSLTLNVDPALDSLSVGATGTTALGVAIGVAR